jgi:dTDP-4-dehydrorhamnose 3,5-epimerase-like enzyme
LKDLCDIRIVNVPCFFDLQGQLVSFNGISDFGINIQRVFVVTGLANSLRGRHAHKELSQIMICVQGSCRVICDDGEERKEFLLNQSNQALILPNGIWAEQIYDEANTVLMVLCDLPYDESDYLRDYNDYLNFRKQTIV